MRKLSLYVLIAIASNVSAQEQPPESPESVLRAWEQAMKDVRGYAAVVKRTTEDNFFKATDVYQGSVLMRKVGDKNPSVQACLDLKKKADPKSIEKFIVKDGEVFEYAPASNTIRVHKVPKNQQANDPSFLSFIFGMTADQAKARYDLSYSKGVPADEYHYLDIVPKAEKEKGDFISARLVFSRKTRMLHQVAYRQRNNNLVIWEFEKIQRDVQIPDEYFDPKLPAGWRMENVKMP